MIKNVVFDLGNVLINFKPMEYVNSKIHDKEKAKKIYEEIFTGAEWPMLDRGVITEEEAINMICSRNLEDSEFIRQVMDNWYQLLTPIEGTVEILKEISNKGYKTYVLSNYQLLAYENVTERYDFFNYFDGGVISYMENLLKPDKCIYNKLTEKFKIDPKESIFIDDTAENIESAKLLGFEGIHFVNPTELRKRLVELNVL